MQDCQNVMAEVKVTFPVFSQLQSGSVAQWSGSVAIEEAGILCHKSRKPGKPQHASDGSPAKAALSLL